MKRIAIFGGTFDPPHAGHLAIVEAVLRHNLADEVWLMVSPENPFKSGKRISPERDRLEMARIAVLTLPEDVRDKVKVSDFESTLARPTYTVTTLRALRKRWPGYAFTLVVGEDNLRSFPSWREPEEILRDFGLIVYPRSGSVSAFPDSEVVQPEMEMSKIPSGCVILEGVRKVDVSSTGLRSALASGLHVSPAELPSGVEEYARSKRLYE